MPYLSMMFFNLSCTHLDVKFYKVVLMCNIKYDFKNP